MSQLTTRIVLRNDIADNWVTNQDQVLMKGEVGLEFLDSGIVKMKIGDGDTAWSDLPYFGGGNETHIYEKICPKGTDHSEVFGSLQDGAGNTIVPVKGNFLIIKEEIIAAEDLVEGVEQKYQYTAYNYDGTNWVAFDGNYSAENVYFSEDFVFTKKIGTVEIPPSGSTTVDAAGKNIKEFFAGIFAKEEYPTTPSTSASITSDNIGAKEVGTNIEINYAFSTTSGSYKYGPSSNGVTWSKHLATLQNNSEPFEIIETLEGANGTFTSVEVKDDTNLSITGSVEQSAGEEPVTNLGNKYPAAQIKKKSWTNLTKGTLTGFRGWFCGYKGINSKGENTALTDPELITGDQIRDLSTTNNSENVGPRNGTWVDDMTVNKMQQMFFAAPKGKASKPSVKNSQNGAPQTVRGPRTVYVKGANNYYTEDAPDGIAYDVWYVHNDAPGTEDNIKLNITW